MGGFDTQAPRQLFAIPASFEPVAVLALGYLEGAFDAQAGHGRKPLSDFVYSGSWGRPASLASEMESQPRPM
jgi:nitroreductase